MDCGIKVWFFISRFFRYFLKNSLFKKSFYYFGPYLCRILSLATGYLAPKSAFVKEKNSEMRHLKTFMKPIEVNRTCIGFKNFFRCLIFDCYNVSICKKRKIKDEASKKFRETNGGQIKEQDVPLT